MSFNPELLLLSIVQLPYIFLSILSDSIDPSRNSVQVDELIEENGGQGCDCMCYSKMYFNYYFAMWVWYGCLIRTDELTPSPLAAAFSYQTWMDIRDALHRAVSFRTQPRTLISSLMKVVQRRKLLRNGDENAGQYSFGKTNVYYKLWNYPF